MAGSLVTVAVLIGFGVRAFYRSSVHGGFFGFLLLFLHHKEGTGIHHEANMGEGVFFFVSFSSLS